jgi:hypothetical protein
MAKLTEPSADEIEVKREILTRYIELCEALPGAAGTLKLAEACSRSSIRALQASCRHNAALKLISLVSGERGAAFGPPFFMRHNHRVVQPNTNTSPSLLDNIPYLWWNNTPVRSLSFY